MATNYILCWTEKARGSQPERDVFQPFEDFEEARVEYDGLRDWDQVKSVTLAAVIDSTDYDTHPDLGKYSRG